MSKKELSPQEVLKHLFEHSFGTYVTLRWGMAIVAVLMPAAVWLWGLWYDIPLQSSISAYYWAGSNRPPSPDTYLFDQYAPSRVWFVGGLFALAACLVLYKGFSRLENFVLNLAAALTVGVALFPTCWRTTCGSFSMHGLCAVLAFACLFYVMCFHAGDTLKLLPDEKQKQRYRYTYGALGTAILILPVVAYVVDQFVGDTVFIFVIEWLALALFAGYWLLKTRELKQSKELIERLIEKATKPEKLKEVLEARGLKAA